MEILVPVALLVVPLLVGAVLAWRWPGMAGWISGLIATAPGSIAIFGLAAFVYVTADMSPCEAPPCHNTGPVWFFALLAAGVVNIAIGFGLGMAGYLVGRQLARKRSGGDGI